MQPRTVSVWLSGSSVWRTRPCALSLDIFPIYQVLYVMHAKKANLHPAGVVRPSYLEIGKDGENGRLVAAASVFRGDGNRWKVGAGIVIHVKAVWTTTKLGAISRADHGAITRGCRSAVIGDGGTAVFRKHRKRL